MLRLETPPVMPRPAQRVRLRTPTTVSAGLPVVSTASPAAMAMKAVMVGPAGSLGRGLVGLPVPTSTSAQPLMVGAVALLLTVAPIMLVLLQPARPFREPAAALTVMVRREPPALVAAPSRPATRVMLVTKRTPAETVAREVALYALADTNPTITARALVVRVGHRVWEMRLAPDTARPPPESALVTPTTTAIQRPVPVVVRLG